jgi:hypothetical protein
VSGETLIRIVEDVILEDACTNSWRYNPLEESIPNYWCAKHSVAVPLSGPCPKSEIFARVGETITVPSKVARRLVEADLAEFPTHAPEQDQAVTETLSRVNALMEAQGLPGMTAEGMSVWKVDGKQENPYKRPAKPSDRRLANDLGLDPADIAAMRKAAGGS